MDFADAKEWSALVLPWAGLVTTAYVALRVQKVHTLVNSEMDKFRATLKALSTAQELGAFRDGQQDIRDKTRATVMEAGKATTAAAEATTAAVTLTGLTKPPPVSP